ncbi:relaxase domain-containing protein [Roseiconus nitratireducens]|uniref:Relaxase domain-containing protein n=1 Tax=Roseiconus nitratireducens TaxID=2605748 RepID=A0A5M6D2V0_9BACT|nr:MobF family relaxase [Roseiconus nitratireducens]KAA5539999.1 relaxase domain-containing protein [Roseiconus nitratireducens]
MLIATQGKSVSGTQQYFEQVLTQGDYYLGQEVSGQWRGQGAELLGLGHGSDVTKQQFNDLLQGNHPLTGERLTQRDRKDRRPGMDLTFSVPKSVSLAWAINHDDRISQALCDAVHETMSRDVEPLMQRRVRNGENANSKQKTATGKLVYADFLHKTSRPVDGKPDPHLHVHAFVINWTEHNGKHYAGEFEEIVRQRPSLQAKFEARLANKLKNELGYDVKHTRYLQSGRIKAGWEIDGVDRKTIEKFSRRTEQVEEYALKNGVSAASEKAKLGQKTREKKDKGTSVETLREEWRSRLSPEESEAFKKLESRERSEDAGREDAAASVKYALDHHLYRESTVERHQVVATALEHGLTMTPERIEKALSATEVIERSINADGTQRHLITTREVLAAEKRMIDFAREGRGTRKSIGEDHYECSRDWLNAEQKAAVNFVLECRDTVMAVTGGAGTGKSSLMQEAAEAIKKSGKELFTFAPSTGAVEVLREKGFGQTETVEHLIRNDRLHPQLDGQVIWIDEAGLLDVRSMNAVFGIAKSQNARVVLSGDTRQHASPRRGEAMRLLEQEAGLNIARVDAIQRQRGLYRDAVEMISKGHEVQESGKTGLLEGFDRLDAMGKVREIGDGDREAILADTYLSHAKNGNSTLVVAPTHAEAKSVTDRIRSSLREMGSLSAEEHPIVQLKSLNLSEAQKREAANYSDQEGAVIQFHQNAKGGFKKSERYRVAGAVGNEVEVISIVGGQKKSLPLDAADRFEVYTEQALQLSAGDKVRFSLGGKAIDGKKRISNGRLDAVKGFDRLGNIVLERGTVIDKDYGHLDLGYVVTSHASQGKDRQVALAAMSSESLPAVNAKQFYVTVSRGSEDVTLFVDDKARMRRAIQKSGEQLSATELVRSGAERSEQNKSHEDQGYLRHGQHLVRSFRDRVLHWWNREAATRDASEPVGRHRQADTGRSMGDDFGRSIGLA